VLGVRDSLACLCELPMGQRNHADVFFLTCWKKPRSRKWSRRGEQVPNEAGKPCAWPGRSDAGIPRSATSSERLTYCSERASSQ